MVISLTDYDYNGTDYAINIQNQLLIHYQMFVFLMYFSIFVIVFVRLFIRIENLDREKIN